MTWRRSGSPSVMVWLAAALAMVLCVLLRGTSEAAQDSLVDCNEVTFTDRCACNERILYALTQYRAIVLDPTQGANAGDAHAAIAIQQERQHRLRTFYAPACELKSSPERLPLSDPHTASRLYGEAIEKHLQPWRTNRITDDPKDPDYDQHDPTTNLLLVGRWEGWLTLFGGKPSPLSVHVISVGEHRPLGKVAPGPLVKACGDQGMVYGRRRNGYVELPRSDFSGLAYSIRLWRSSAPHSRDLEGVVLLEVRPGEVLVAGLVWLGRSLKFDWTAPPSSYFCQDRDLEEQRKNFREEIERIKREQEPDPPS